MPSPGKDDGKWPKDFQPYSMELRVQASAAAAAFSSLEAHVHERKALATEVSARMKAGIPPLEMERQNFEDLITRMTNLIGPILGDVQSFLTAVGVIETILWPSSARQHKDSEESVRARVERGKMVRKLLRVPDDSPLQTRNRGELDARGGLLHIDEMIDEFLHTPRLRYVSLEVGDFTGREPPPQSTTIRWLDENTLELWVNGRRRNLRDVRMRLEETIGKLVTNAVMHFEYVPETPGEVPPAPRLSMGSDL